MREESINRLNNKKVYKFKNFLYYDDFFKRIKRININSTIRFRFLSLLINMALFSSSPFPILIKYRESLLS